MNKCRTSNNRTHPRTGLLGLLISLVAATGLAAEGTPAPKEDFEQVRESIAEMRARARQMRADTRQEYDRAIEKCGHKVFNSKCIDRAKLVRDRGEYEANRIDKSALAIEKSVKTETRDTKRATQAEKERNRLSMSNKKELEAANKREKARLQLEKLRSPAATPEAKTE